MILPSYSIGSDVYSKIKDFCLPFGEKIIVIGGHKAINSAKEKLLKAVSDSGMRILDFIWFGHDCTYSTVENLSKNPEVQNADMIFALGGGKSLDTCKCLAEKINKPIFTFPTIASNCACCTSVSIMYNDDGTFKEPFFFLQPPHHAFIDTEIISQSPMKYMWAGIGDTYAKYYESTISGRNEILEHFNAFGIQMSKMCVDPILMYGEKALKDNENKICSYELEQVVLAIAITTGMVSIFITREHTPDYNSGLAHAIFYALTSFPHIEKDHLHGEVVSLGVLAMLLVDNQKDEFAKIYDFNKATGLPTKMADLEISKEQLSQIIKDIPSRSDVKHWPYPVTEGMLQSAFDTLDGLN